MPSRQLLPTWVVDAWDLISEKLVKKSWTACGDKSEKDTSRSNGGNVVVFSNEQVGSVVEEICGDAA